VKSRFGGDLTESFRRRRPVAGSNHDARHFVEAAAVVYPNKSAWLPVRPRMIIAVDVVERQPVGFDCANRASRASRQTRDGPSDVAEPAGLDEQGENVA
jgi:hypothetical protein